MHSLNTKLIDYIKNASAIPANADEIGNLTQFAHDLSDVSPQLQARYVLTIRRQLTNLLPYMGHELYDALNKQLQDILLICRKSLGFTE